MTSSLHLPSIFCIFKRFIASASLIWPAVTNAQVRLLLFVQSSQESNTSNRGRTKSIANLSLFFKGDRSLSANDVSSQWSVALFLNDCFVVLKKFMKSRLVRFCFATQVSEIYWGLLLIRATLLGFVYALCWIMKPPSTSSIDPVTKLA